MTVIDLEAHFLTPDIVEYLRSTGWISGISKDSISERSLLDLGEGRIQCMDAAGIDRQVLSLPPPGVQMLEPSEGIAWSKRVNDELSAAVTKYPDRFLGLATVAPQNPKAAADEIERAVTELGLKGVSLLSHARNEYLDAKEYWVIFERAEMLDVPICLHPAIPSTAILKPYADYGPIFAGPVLGYSADLALHTMRLIFSGLFDRYPKLKIILGHMGEGLPYWLPRLDIPWRRTRATEKPAIERRPSEYIKSNFTITISGMFFQPAFICAYQAVGANNIAFAVDYPYEDIAEALQFMQEAPINDGDKEKIYHLNAESLFKL